MKKSSFSRRSFVKTTSAGTAGLAITSGAFTSLYLDVIQDTEKPAILGGKPVFQKGSGLAKPWPVYDDSDIQMFMDSYKGNVWSEFSSSEKELTTIFEKEYAKLIGTSFCVAVNSGTDALETAQRACEIGPGDEVITQSNSFIATPQSTFNLYALPVFVDSDPETFMIDADRIEERITPNTKAILPVHIGGCAADMDKILAIAKKHNLLVIEDACQAHLGEWRGKRLGGVGTLGCFSFQAFKCLCGGEGGAVTGNNDELMARVDAYTNNGRDPRGLKRSFPGSNFRMVPFVAANLLGQIKRIEAQTAVREENAKYLETLLAEIKGVRPTKKNPGMTRRAYYQYQLIYDKEHFNGLSKTRFREAMAAEGVGFGNGASSLHLDPSIEAYLNLQGFKKIFPRERLERYRKENNCPETEKIVNETGLFLNQRSFLGTKQDMEKIVVAIEKIRKHAGELI